MKILIVTQIFFPDRRVGAIRITQFAKYAVLQGHEVVIVCRSNIAGAVEEIQKYFCYSNRIKVIPLTFIEPNLRTSQRGKLKGAINSIVRLAPDNEILFWIRESNRILSIIREESPDWTITSGPPHSIHCIGLLLKNKISKSKWCVDFRDPFTIDSRFRGRGINRYLNIFLERKIYRSADIVVHAIKTHHLWCHLKFKNYRRKIHFVPNGFPPEMLDVQLAGDSLYHDEEGVVKVMICGKRNEDRLEYLVDILRNAIGDNFKIYILGERSSKAHIKQLVERGIVKELGMCSHLSTLNMMKSADILVSFPSTVRAQSHLCSTKLFEYIALGKVIVAISPTVSDRWLLTYAERKLVTELDEDVNTNAVVLRKLLQSNVVACDKLASYRSTMNRRELTRRWVKLLIDR